MLDGPGDVQCTSLVRACDAVAEVGPAYRLQVPLSAPRPLLLNRTTLPIIITRHSYTDIAFNKLAETLHLES